MRSRQISEDRGSGLIIALSILAMLAIMATSFITMARLERRAAASYVDELKCEMLAQGALNYFKGLLRDDLDRTWGKYENRDAAVGAVGWQWSSDGGGTVMNLPAMCVTEYGTAYGNDFWFNPPYKAWTDWGNTSTGEYDDMGIIQQSFVGNTGWSKCVLGRHVDTENGQEVQMWIARTMAYWKNDGSGVIVDADHPQKGDGIDFSGDGIANQSGKPQYYDNTRGEYVYKGEFNEEEGSATNLYYDAAPFVLMSGDSYYFPGKNFTGEEMLPGGTMWRWAVRLGLPHGGYANMNVWGNLDGADSSYLQNMGRIGLRAERAVDETDDTHGTENLGRLHFRGFQGEYNYEKTEGFPRFYNEVAYHPSQLSLERLFTAPHYNGATYNSWDTNFSLDVDRARARELLNYRMGGDRRMGDGSDNYRVGWRQDAATYYLFESPQNPLGNSRFFGVNDVVEHDRATYHPGTTAIAKYLAVGEWRKLRPYSTFWSTDTILRGKIYPTEGPLTWRHADAGDWRHIDILKRINLNMIGAGKPVIDDGPQAREFSLPGQRTDVINDWIAKAPRERDRLYFMLKAGLVFGGDSEALAAQKAVQFIASLTDMIDRDNDEFYYEAPDGSGKWAIGVEKFPVINEILVALADANVETAWDPRFLRFELLNCAENIPWIPDEQEGYYIGDYVITMNNHQYVLKDLKLFSDNNEDETPLTGEPAMIGADGIFAMADAAKKQTWSRLLHFGWKDSRGFGWPDDWGTPDQIRAELKGGVEFKLWKKLASQAADRLSAGANVRVFDGAKYLCVDKTAVLHLVKYPGAPGICEYASPTLNEVAAVGIYRRFDPMNGLTNTEGKYDLNPGYDPWCWPNLVEGKDERSNVYWLFGWNWRKVGTLGRPNYPYPKATDSQGRPYNYRILTGSSSYGYYRHLERNFKIVNGDLPSIGWLGELVLWNAAADGPLTWVHKRGQHPGQHTIGSKSSTDVQECWASELDTKAKFDLYRPFERNEGLHPDYVNYYNANTGNCKTQNLHLLDIFTLWDPSNDGVDNDGDGAVDDEDSGRQPGDKAGPEVRVFGKLDLNLASRLAAEVPFADNQWAHGRGAGDGSYAETLHYGRLYQRHTGLSGGNRGAWGAIDSIGDMLRADKYTYKPGWWMAGGTNPWISGPTTLAEGGFARFACGVNWDASTPYPKDWLGDDDGDGVFDERDERDMLFTWAADYFTTRSNVFEIDLVVDICEPPYRPDTDNPLQFKTYRTRRSFVHKRILGTLDRSTCLRVADDGTCDFSGPVEVRMMRFTDDLRANY